MDLTQAIQAHTEWKLKLRTAIARSETLDVAKIAVDNGCPLGSWLHGEARTRFGHLESYTKCLASHAAFHKEAGKVAQRVNMKKFAEAEEMLRAGSAFANASTAVGTAIIHLRAQCDL